MDDDDEAASILRNIKVPGPFNPNELAARTSRKRVNNLIYPHFLILLQ